MPGIPPNVGAAPGGEVDAMHIEPADDVGGNAEPEVGAAAGERGTERKCWRTCPEKGALGC